MVMFGQKILTRIRHFHFCVQRDAGQGQCSLQCAHFLLIQLNVRICLQTSLIVVDVGSFAWKGKIVRAEIALLRRKNPRGIRAHMGRSAVRYTKNRTEVKPVWDPVIGQEHTVSVHDI